MNLLKFLVVFLFSVTGVHAELKIGAILPLSGPWAEYGQAMHNGIQLAMEHRPPTARMPHFIFEDAQGEVRHAVSAFNKLVNQDRVDLIYVWGVQYCSALIPLAEQYKVPLVAQCVSRSKIKNTTQIVYFMNPAIDFMRTTIEVFRNRGLRKFSMVLSDHSYTEEMYSVLDQLLLPGEEAHIIERLSGKEMDFRSTITKIRQHQPEVLVVFLLAGQIAEFYRQLADQKLSIPTFGTNLFECRSEITRANGAMDGAIWANPLVSSQFQAQYLAKFGEQSQISWAALAYEFANLTSRIVETDPKITTGADLLFRLSQPSNYSGFAVGEFSAVNSSDIPYYRFKLTAKTVKNGEVIQTDVN